MALDLAKAKLIINDDSLSDELLQTLLDMAFNEALNRFYWKQDDIPTDEQKEAFENKWEYEIYQVAKAMNADDSRDGLISHSELGISRVWGESSRVGVTKALEAIPAKVYVL